jgi:hypothetical protein
MRYNYQQPPKREHKYNYHFRSQAERRWADYLETLKELGAIKSWEYEPKRFACGQHNNKWRFYTPDFKVIEDDNGLEVEVWHEVKMSLEQKDISRFKWFVGAHPDKIIVLILPRAAKKRQAELRYKAHNYVKRIVYANPLYKKYGIK